jgi:glycosyltransferase involved in cell wall biosynthesis
MRVTGDTDHQLLPLVRPQRVRATGKAMKRMRIAQIAPLYESVPPRYYGGTERVVAYLCDALVELGHEVTLFASADARTQAQLIAVRDEAMRLDNAPLKSDMAAHLTELYEVRRRVRQFDILHFHIDLLHFPLFEQHADNSVTTLHGRLDLKDLPQVYARWPQFGLVSISNAQRRPLPRANWLETIGHGLPERLYPDRPRAPGGYLAFLGRISPEKRPDLAIRLALLAGLPLKIAAKVDTVDRAYFESTIRPLLGQPGVDYVGEIGDADKADFLGGAAALLFPVNWPEPFGLVMIEAMACGTPVVAWNCGSVAEIVEPGVSGFIVESEAQALAALARIDTLDRRAVRQCFERRFTATAMAEAYLRLYQRLLDARPLDPAFAARQHRV